MKSRQLDKNRKTKIDWQKYNFEIISKLTLIHSISLCTCGLVKNAKTEVQGLASYERERETRPKVKRKKETEYERGKNRAAKEVRRTIIVRICSHFIFVRRVCSI